jgi:antitoxin VapB
MAFHVRDEATDLAVRRLAKLKKKTLTATIREAVEHEYERECGTDPFMESVRAIQDWVQAHSRPGGLPADKAFYDKLSGEEELTGLP